MLKKVDETKRNGLLRWGQGSQGKAGVKSPSEEGWVIGQGQWESLGRGPGAVPGTIVPDAAHPWRSLWTFAGQAKQLVLFEEWWGDFEVWIFYLWSVFVHYRCFICRCLLFFIHLMAKLSYPWDSGQHLLWSQVMVAEFLSGLSLRQTDIPKVEFQIDS